MKYLLDTHAFLWWIDDSPRLSAEARGVIGDGRNQIFFSAASGWEIAVKSRLGKLVLPRLPGKYIPEQVRLNDFQVMPVELSHALHVHSLPLHHRDPFDHVLIAQSVLEGMPIITRDGQFAAYEVSICW
jgi:PIN domain nuclease of toxin-antitoxin system